MLLWNTSSAQMGVSNDKGGEAMAHKQPKFVGRANNLANPGAQQSRSTEADKQANDPSLNEKKALSQEERRALRRQISETEVKYPRR